MRRIKALMAMKTIDFGAVAPLGPINRTAGNVVAKGEHYAPTFDSTHKRFTAPPLCAPKPTASNFKDRTGQKLGKLTVYGYAGSHKSHGGMWYVRCLCGVYEVRRGKIFDQPAFAPRAMCIECDRVDQLRKSYSSVDKLKFHHIPSKKSPAGR